MFKVITKSYQLTSSLLIIGLFNFMLPITVKAQILPDATLPNNSVVNQNGQISEIKGGTQAGSNLFHSFDRFSLNTGETAFFNQISAIQNIFTRVTGNQISNIDGLIRANGTANLFLVNPNGVIFGPNATLNIGGSFFASTGDSIIFADGTQFSAKNPSANTLLTVSVPLGLQYGNNPKSITVQGNGNSLFLNAPDNPSVNRSERAPGLQVNNGQTLALIGGDVILDGGNLTANDSKITVGSVKNGTVKLISNDTGWNLDFQDISQFQDVNLVNSASIEVSGNNGGEINLHAQNILVSDGSAILANTLGNGNGGQINLNATNEILAIGTAPEFPFPTYISTDVDNDAIGKGGDINIKTNSLAVVNGAQISSGTFGSGNSGSLNVEADEIELFSGSRYGPSGLFAPVASQAEGKGGEININTQNLFLSGGAQVFNGTLGIGDGGKVNIKAQNIEIGEGIESVPSSIISSVERDALGDGGDLNIETKNLTLIDGGQVSVFTTGFGKAGNLNLTANKIEIDGIGIGGRSGIFASAFFGSGDGGDLNISTDKLTINNGATINVSNYASFNANIPQGKGSAGNLNLQANILQLDHESVISAENFASGGGILNLKTDQIKLENNSVITSNATGTTTGGNINIESNILTINSGSQISANALDVGDAGAININSNELNIIGSKKEEVTGIFAQVEKSATGNGGNLQVEAQNIEITKGGEISASTFSIGNGGSVIVSSDRLSVNNGGKITASSSAEGNAGELLVTGNESINISGKNTGLFANTVVGGGNGGNLTVNTPNLTITDNAIINVSNIEQPELPLSIEKNNSAGNIIINSPNLQILDGASIRAETLLGDEGNITINTRNMFMDDKAIVSTNAQGSSTGGNININSKFMILNDKSIISANAQQGFGGRVVINTEGLFLSPESAITATSELGEEFNGVVEINNPNVDAKSGLVDVSSAVIGPQDAVVAGCAADPGNVFAVKGKGGIPESPNQVLAGNSTWQDLRPLGDENISNTSNVSSSDKQNHQIVEAQGWIVGNNGNIILTANAPETTPSHRINSRTNCL